MNKRILLISLLLLALGVRNYGQNVNPPTILCVNDNASNGDITIQWALPVNNNCGTFVQYTIYASPGSANGPYTPVAVTNQAATSYTLTGYLNVNATWYFYMISDYNCPGGTVISSDTVNNLAPATPVITDVSVNGNNQAVITFQPSTSQQTSHYIVYYYQANGTALPWDTVYGINNTIVVDLDTLGIHNPTIHSLALTVAAIDSCGNRSSFNTSPQYTILAAATNTECQRQVNIAWSKYLNWPRGVAQYQVWVSVNGGPFVENGTTDSATLSYSFSNFNTGDSLQIYIRATSGADTTISSFSNSIRMKAIIVQPPSYIYLTNITVNSANQIDITWTIDTAAQLIFYELMQSTDSIVFRPAEQIATPVPLQHFQTFGDSDYVFPQNNPYYYQVDAYDSCQNQYLTPTGKSVCLQGGLYDYYVAKLTWNEFELSYATVVRYNLYRDFGNGGFQLIKSFPPGVDLYFDSLEQFLNEKGTFCYRIEAVYYLNLPAPSGYHDTLISSSNQVCIVHRPVIYVPNAFAPNGGVPENTTFKPTIIYGSPSGYSLIIFNRWGGKVFESNNPTIGWDGTDHGKPSEMGGYGYLIDFIADDGTPIERKGIVLLVR